MQASDQSLAARAVEYFAACKAGRAKDRRRARMEKSAHHQADDIRYDGQKIFSLQHLETMRPSEPMTPEELQETIERLQRGNALLAAEYPAKLAAFEDALKRGRAHFATLTGDPDEDDDLWSSIHEIEIAAYRPHVRTHADAVAFLKLLADFFRVTGVNDRALEKLIPARLREAIAILEGRQ